MTIETAVFKGSFVALEKCPADALPEFAFIGRSNVGKSSLINFLTAKPGLSKVSGTPGKTQTINFFLINDRFHFVDLPGYGYARTSKEMRAKWDVMIRNYLSGRKQLQYVCVLIDSRIPPQKSDLEFIGWLGSNQVPFIVIFTKADKPKRNDVQGNIRSFAEALLQDWEDLPPSFLTSADKQTGKEDLLAFFAKAVAEFRMPESASR